MFKLLRILSHCNKCTIDNAAQLSYSVITHVLCHIHKSLPSVHIVKNSHAIELCQCDNPCVSYCPHTCKRIRRDERLRNRQAK